MLIKQEEEIGEEVLIIDYAMMRKEMTLDYL